MKPPKGYYRELLAGHFPEIRIAFTHTPIHGCKIVPSENVLKVLEKFSDPYAKFYIDGIRSGEMVTIVENDLADRFYKNNGELYFNS